MGYEISVMALGARTMRSCLGCLFISVAIVAAGFLFGLGFHLAGAV